MVIRVLFVIVSINVYYIDPSLVLGALRIIVLLARNKHGVFKYFFQILSVLIIYPNFPGDYVRQMLKSKVRKLAKQRKGFIGSMAVSAFEVLREQGASK